MLEITIRSEVYRTGLSGHHNDDDPLVRPKQTADQGGGLTR